MDAYELLSRADVQSSLPVEDLELLATAAYMLGRGEDHVRVLERAHQAYLDGDEPERAARCAFWAGLSLALRREAGRATGWFGRAQRLIERAGGDCVERGYLLIPVLHAHEVRGDFESVYATAVEAAEIAERHRDADLHVMALHEQGRALVGLGRIAEGLDLLDEAMVAVLADDLSPIVTGLMYCSVIDGCRQAQALSRAREWTSALSQWCERQPDMVAFTGQCLTHRAEILELHGAWPDALVEAERALRRSAESGNQGAAGEAAYRMGELHRLRGDLAEAEDAYRVASRYGREPQPGLARLRMAQGRNGAAAAAMRRLAAETTEPVRRAFLLPAYVEIMLGLGELDEAATACDELAAIAAAFASELLSAVLAQTQGALKLAGDPRAALVPLRRALRAWQELDVPYEGARVRVLVAAACRALGDEDSAALELEAARAAFEQLGARPDIARLDSSPSGAHGLTAREVQVLRLVAAGRTNKEIAAVLVLSERTVDRHVSNILAKLGATSRAAATARAYEHALLSG
jgi:DNA-binding CsgD family transcriptional regulator